MPKLPISLYAEACGVVTQTIWDRINAGKIDVIRDKDGAYIDTDKFPPQPPQKRGRKRLAPKF